MGGKLVKAAIVAASFAAVLSAGPATAAPVRATTGDCSPVASWGTLQPDLASAALTLINQHRTSMGLAALNVSPSLTAAANWKSLHMAGTNYFDHYDINYPTAGVYRDPFDRMRTCGCSASISPEEGLLPIGLGWTCLRHTSNLLPWSHRGEPAA